MPVFSGRTSLSSACLFPYCWSHAWTLEAGVLGGVACPPPYSGGEAHGVTVTVLLPMRPSLVTWCRRCWWSPLQRYRFPCVSRCAFAGSYSETLSVLLLVVNSSSQMLAPASVSWPNYSCAGCEMVIFLFTHSVYMDCLTLCCRGHVRCFCPSFFRPLPSLQLSSVHVSS